ncbi:MAG: peptide deformylase [Mycoplasma sp.]
MQTKKSKLKVKVDNTLQPTMDWLLFDNNPKLRNKSEDVLEITPQDQEVINKMVSYVDASFEEKALKYKIKPGIAVAAPQLGLFKKIIYIHFQEGEDEYRYLLANPEIIAKSQIYSFIRNGEGCLSVKLDEKGCIPRSYKIIVKATDLFTGEEVEISAVELLSVCLQHEIDHLDGILYVDRINKDNPNYIDPKWLVIG